MSSRRSIGRPAKRWAPARRSWNPLVRWAQAVRDPEAGWGRRLMAAVGGAVGFALALALVGALAFAGYAWRLAESTPDAYALARATRSQPTVVLDVRGKRLTQFEPDFREWVPLDSIPLHLVDALLATEDRRFYAHGGVDVRRTAAAVWNTARGRREGGSTVTQQLARNLFPEEIGSEGTVRRKTMEMLAARAIERDHTKREILEAYLNTVPFLYNATGVELAARTYFGAHAPDLTVPQAATLVAMLKGPDAYNPVRRPEAAKKRRDLVLRLMADTGALSRADAARYQAAPLGVELAPQPSTYSAAPHFTAAVRAALDAWAVPRGYDVDRDGLVVWTTLDLGLQREAEAAVAERAQRLQRTADAQWRRGPPRRALDAALRRTDAYARLRDGGASEADALADRALVDSVGGAVRRVEAALVALVPETGAVRAYVGSRDFAVDEYDHAGVARRQPGSTFKAFVFASALQRGYAPDDEIEGGAATVELDDGTEWTPTGGVSAGTLEDALAYSKNAATARLTQEVGPHRVALVAQQMGVESPLDVVPSIGLGTSPVTLLEMVSAYGTAANEGLRRAPLLITRVETASGQVLDTFGGTGAQVLTRRDARNLVQMLRAAVDRGTGRDLRRLGATGDLAGKTGTTQRYADGWFIALRPGLAVGAWVGFNDPRVTFRSKATGEGSKTALPVVAGFLSRVQDRLPPATLPAPPETFDFAFGADSLTTGDPWGGGSWEDDPWGDGAYGAGWDVDRPLRGDSLDIERPEQDRPALGSGRPARDAGWSGAADRGRIGPPDPRGQPPPRLRGPGAPRAPEAPREPAGAAPPRTAPPREPAPVTNPNNRGGRTAEEMIRDARDGGADDG
ncbi:transglycosylase domain-containing protein [Rubrivirga litoralis]|uniref:Transglycosylase domain-containing protein n=1 Tax=Rubrivirga litoralis TaxID=3075598 RepID=A0ABU3BPV4_9BACT|nr:transglycosylase domain-containing protein [Rubrivirga sp. F394]MDT0631295.1 transglycosylase domain-containing protein [Rubrivirga sp. F394]